MTSKEPEDLFPEYRKEFTQKIVKVMKTGESLSITAASGSGKSKYLRYISKSDKVFNSYFSNILSKLVYIDLNKLFNFGSADLVELIAKSLNTTPKKLEVTIKTLINNKKLYLILDHAEVLNFLQEPATRYLRALRDENKNCLGIIFSYEEGNSITTSYILQFAKTNLVLPPLNKVDSEKVLNIETKKYGLMLLEEEKTRILVKASGNGGKIKEEVLKKYSGELNTEGSIKTNMLSEARKILTKSEYEVFYLLFENLNNIVSINQMADTLNPNNSGEGVSNESIEQIILRIRKKLKSNSWSINIINKHGVGFYIK